MMISALELRIALIVVAVIVIIVFVVWYRANSKDIVANSVTQQDQDFSSDIEDILTLPARDAKEDLPDDLRSEFQHVSQSLRKEKISQRVQAAQQERASRQYKSTHAGKAESSHDTVTDAHTDRQADQDRELLIVLHVVAKPQAEFTGPMIKQMMTELDLEYGDMGAYHYNVERLDRKHSVYCVLNMFQPGSFDTTLMADFSTRGLTMVLQLPGPEDSLKAFNIMCEHAHRLATFLNADLLDQDHNPVTTQALSHYKEQVQLFGLRVGRRSTLS